MSDAVDTTITPESFRLDGRIAVVTGAAQGIGAATACTLARFGADVAVCDKLAGPLGETADAIASTGRRVVSSVMDVRDDEAVAAFLAGVASDFGRVDVLVNNAGGGFYAPFMEVSVKGQGALIAENFTQATSFIRGCVPLMTEGGSIVNITSIEAHRAGPGFGIYSAMKAGLENLTKTLALELADLGIRVNSVAPDMIPTPGDALLTTDSGAMADAIAHSALTVQPVRHAGSADDCAAAVLYLSSAAGRFVTGTTLHVDGGTHAASGWKRGDEGRWRL